jgi:hypothetical protein
MPLAACVLVTSRVAAALAAMVLVRTPRFRLPMMQAIAGAFALLVAARVLTRRLGMIPKRPVPDRSGHCSGRIGALFSATASGVVYAHGAVIIMGPCYLRPPSIFTALLRRSLKRSYRRSTLRRRPAFPLWCAYMPGLPAPSGGRWASIWQCWSAHRRARSSSCSPRETNSARFAGQGSDRGVEVVVLWLAASLFTIISVSLNPVMIVLRLGAPMAKVYRVIGLTFLVATPIACVRFGVLGMAVATLITEGFMALFCAGSVIGSLRAIGDADSR